MKCNRGGVLKAKFLWIWEAFQGLDRDTAIPTTPRNLRSIVVVVVMSMLDFVLCWICSCTIRVGVVVDRIEEYT